MLEKNAFSDLLQSLLIKSGVKQSRLSEAVSYDLSYVNKWLSGKILPAEKNIFDITNSISACIVSNLSNSETQKEFFDAYCCDNLVELERKISIALQESFNSSKGIRGIRAQAPKFFPEVSYADLFEFFDNNAEDTNAVIFIDIFRMTHEDRLRFAGIRNGRLSPKKVKHNFKISIVISIDGIKDNVYDCLYLIHLVTSFSKIDCSFFNNRFSEYRLLFLANERIAISASLLENYHYAIATSIIEEGTATTRLFDIMQQELSHSSLLFLKIFMKSFIGLNHYYKSLLSNEIMWIIGHAIELLLPSDLFMDVLNRCQESYNSFELLKLHDLSMKLIYQSSTKILLYETVISDMLATHELDFYNIKVHLSNAEILTYIDYLIELNDKLQNFRLIGNSFNADFEHIYSPCLFLSDYCSYLRIENAYDRENIYVLNDPKLKADFKDFYFSVWENRKDIVCDDKWQIKKRLGHYRELVMLLG